MRFSKAPRDGYPSYYKPTLWERLASPKLIKDDPKLNAKSLQGRYEATFDALGPAGADYFLSSHILVVWEGHARRAIAISSSPSRKPLLYVDSADTESSSMDGDGDLSPGFRRAMEVLSKFQKRLLSDTRALPTEWLSPKLQAVVDILVEHRSESFQGMIFVDQRQIVKALCWILGRIAETKDWIRCGALTGHGEQATEGEKIKGMGINAQREVVQSFKAGDLNLCKALSVVLQRYQRTKLLSIY